MNIKTGHNRDNSPRLAGLVQPRLAGLVQPRLGWYSPASDFSLVSFGLVILAGMLMWCRCIMP